MLRLPLEIFSITKHLKSIGYGEEHPRWVLLPSLRTLMVGRFGPNLNGSVVSIWEHGRLFEHFVFLIFIDEVAQQCRPQ